MRNYSKVSPRFWTGTLGRFTVRGNGNLQAIALYLVTSPHANMIGLYDLPLPYMVADLGHPEEEILENLRTLQEARFSHYDHETGRVWVVDHLRHELADKDGKWPKASDNRWARVEKILRDHSVSTLVRAFCEHYDLPFDTEQIVGASTVPVSPSEGATQGPCEAPSPQEQEQEQEQEQGGGVVVPDALAPLSRLLDRARAACGSTRKSGQMADSVWQGALNKLAQYPFEAVVAGVRTYLDREDHLEGKDERYLVGVVRGMAKEQALQRAHDAAVARDGIEPNPEPDQQLDIRWCHDCEALVKQTDSGGWERHLESEQHQEATATQREEATA